MTTSTPSSRRVDASTEGATALAKRLGHTFGDISLLEHALAHRSWCGEQEGGAPSNERLEYLGDAVLGLVVARYSFERYPDFPEGMLAKVRSAVVNSRVLAQVAERLGIGEVLLLGKGEESSGGRKKASILADAFEAVLGAVYLDAGWEAAEGLILRELTESIARAGAEPDDFDHKSRLQELAVHRGQGTPRYVVVGSGPDHDRCYTAEVFVGGALVGEGSGRSKKDAEQEAAREAWRRVHEGDGETIDDRQAGGYGYSEHAAQPDDAAQPDGPGLPAGRGMRASHA
ncbi:MAG TPA: ribonuclease III [Acidimicrobiales bacterium]|nr:ribonuclease III [Acidimicrobiales bacterium]